MSALNRYVVGGICDDLITGRTVVLIANRHAEAYELTRAVSHRLARANIPHRFEPINGRERVTLDDRPGTLARANNLTRHKPDIVVLLGDPVVDPIELSITGAEVIRLG